MMAEFDLETLDDLAGYICDRSEAAVRERIAKLPDGAWSYEMHADGYETPIKLSATATVEGDGITVDYSGTSGVQPRGVGDRAPRAAGCDPERHARIRPCFGGGSRRHRCRFSQPACKRRRW